MRTGQRRLVVTGVLGTVAAATVVASGSSATAAGKSERQKDLAEARSATAQYHDVSEAVADGFVADTHCVSAPPGTMGIHYVNDDNFGSTDPAQPAALMYVPDGEGGLRLVGAEWIVPEAGHPVSPEMFGRSFGAAMDGHGPLVPDRHYDLHAWLWAHNPSGMFALFNPRISC